MLNPDSRLDGILDDAATELRDQGMLELAGAIDVARARLLGEDDGPSSRRLLDLESDAPMLEGMAF